MPGHHKKGAFNSAIYHHRGKGSANLVSKASQARFTTLHRIFKGVHGILDGSWGILKRQCRILDGVHRILEWVVEYLTGK